MRLLRLLSSYGSRFRFAYALHFVGAGAITDPKRRAINSSDGGYNTLAEAALHAVPAVCVPRVAPRSEQLIRARAFERLGLLRLLHPG